MLFPAYQSLFSALLAREIEARYRGSGLGMLWTIMNPLLFMLVYFFVFNLVFRVRLPQLYEGRDVPFAGFLLSGLIVYFLFSEVITKSPSLIRDNSNYVKKVAFPLSMIPVVSVAGATFNFIVSFALLCAFLMLFGTGLPPTTLFAPLVVFPFLLFLVGIAWFLSALSVFMKDITYVAGFFSTAMTFLSPVFYGTEAVPEEFRGLMMLNPLTHFIEGFRSCVLGGIAPDMPAMTVMYSIATASLLFGYWFFRKVRGGFADVL